MPEETLKQKSVRGVVWSVTNTTSIYVVQFVVSIVLARLLVPEDFGIVCVAYVVMALIECITNVGLFGAFIQKKDVDELDCNTFFWSNLVMSTCIYAVAFFAAPKVADFYDEPILVPVIRIVALNPVMGSFQVVQLGKLSRNLNFKIIGLVGIVSAVVSCIIAMLLAYDGWGVWTLVWQNFSATAVGVCVINVISPWRPGLSYSWERFRRFFSFSSKLMATGILDICCNNISRIVIGKCFSIRDLGFYTKGVHFPQFVMSAVNGPISNVSFPMLAKLQDDPERYRSALRKSLKTSTFFVAPMMAGLVVTAEPLTLLLFGEKWLPSVVFLRIAAVYLAFYPISTLNQAAIKGLGRSDIFFWIEIVKKILIVAVMMAAFPFGLLIFVLSQVPTTLLSVLIDTLPLKRLIGYSTWMQMKDVGAMFLGSAIMVALLYPMNFLAFNRFVIMAVQVPLGVGIYAVHSWIFNRELLMECIDLTKGILFRRRR